MKLRVFSSMCTKRLAEFVHDRWRLELNEAMALMVADNDPLTSQADIGAALGLHPNVVVALVKRRRLGSSSR
jgi:hypothetical protein